MRDINRYVSERVRGIAISATKEMPMVAAKRGDCVSLGQGVPSFATPGHVADAVCRALRDDHTAGKYSLQPGMPALRQEIARLLEREKGLRADPETEIAVTVGGMEGLACAILTLVDQGDEVILPEPYYPSHVEQVVLAQGRPRFAPLRREDWSLDIDALKAAVTDKTRAVIINSPHNPTGSVFSEADLRAVAALALERGLFVICDEAYDSLSYDGPAFSLASLPELRQNLVLVGSFSKRFFLTGWRVGFVHAHRALMAEMLKVHDCTAICAPTVSQHAALAALTGPQDVFLAGRQALAERRQRMQAHLDRLAEHFSYTPTGGAFYIMARYHLEGMDSRETALALIKDAGVVTIPGGAFGPGGEGALRLSYGGGEEEIDEAFRRMETWFRSV